MDIPSGSRIRSVVGLSAFDDAVWKVATENFVRQTILRSFYTVAALSDTIAPFSESNIGHAALRRDRRTGR
jgi:hypothetical protein